jgi:hypothetical protein
MELNKLFRRYPDNKSGLPRGVSKQSRYVSLAIIDGKRVELGRFDDPMDAHIAWQESRHKTLLKLADESTGRLREALQIRAARVRTHIENRMEINQL